MLDVILESAIRVLVADDTRLHTSLLADALRRDGAFEVIASDSQELIGRPHLLNIDVLLLSSEMDGHPGRGFEILRKVRELHPGLHAVMLLDSSKAESVLEAFRAGVRGILSRQESVEVLSKCLRTVYQGQIWANSQQLSLLLQAWISSRSIPMVAVQGMENLSRRETEIVDAVAQGWSNREIAERLGLSQHTVKNYLFKVFEKLGVSSRIELLSVTFHRSGKSQPSNRGDERNKPDDGIPDESSLIEWRRAAERGITKAQIELARFYSARNADHHDVAEAYKWYLIAGRQISRASKSIGSAMTAEQRLEAEELAASWVKKPDTPAMHSMREPVAVRPNRKSMAADTGNPLTRRVAT